MSNIDTVKAGQAAWCAGDWDTLAALLTDDFVFSGPVPQPLNKAMFISLGKAILSAIPDWDFHARDFREEGDKVYATDAITGTHTGTLAAIPGVPPVPATGKSIKATEGQEIYTFRGNLVSQFEVQAPGGGLAEIYAQVGAPLA
jgi:predicted ester cyclase